MKITLPFGCWPSKLSAELLAADTLRFGCVQAVAQSLYWSEIRPSEQGRSVIRKHTPGQPVQDLLPAGYSAQSRVHEYGGGEFLATGEMLYFTNHADQDIYAIPEEPSDTPSARPLRRLTRVHDTRFADFALDARRNRLICVAEQHPAGAQSNGVRNFLAAVTLQEGENGCVTPLAEGHDFYANPRLSPDGRHLTFLAWDLPHMPWEAAKLYCAHLDDAGGLSDLTAVAGGPRAAVFQPDWLADGRLVFICEASGWNLPYIWSPEDGQPPRALLVREADFAQPLWVLHMRSWAQIDSEQLAVRYVEKGQVKLARLALTDGHLQEIATPFCELTEIVAPQGQVACLATRPDRANALVMIAPESGAVTPVRPAPAPPLDGGDIAHGRIIEIAAETPASRKTEGAASTSPLFGIYYPPTSTRHQGPTDTRPPVILRVHGGPSDMADRGFHLRVQYWTSRGFGVFDVDYAGSTGYGRAWRERLSGHWGRRDVADIIRAGRYLIDAGLADPARLLISGRSAGGFTALMALAQSRLFAAACVSYGVSDMARLAAHMHKFESGYIHTLTGIDDPQDTEALRRLSPISHVAQITSPVIFFQGSADTIVPADQTQQIVTTLQAAGVPVAIYEFEGEGHGFRQSDTISRAQRLEQAFYAAILGLCMQDDLPHVMIYNKANIVAGS